MNPAVREVRASPPLLRKTAVPAFDTATASWAGVKFWLPSAARASISRPSRSTTAMTEPWEICFALPAAWEKITARSLAVSPCPSAQDAAARAPALASATCSTGNPRRRQGFTGQIKKSRGKMASHFPAFPEGGSFEILERLRGCREFWVQPQRRLVCGPRGGRVAFLLEYVAEAPLGGRVGRRVRRSGELKATPERRQAALEMLAAEGRDPANLVERDVVVWSGLEHLVQLGQRTIIFFLGDVEAGKGPLAARDVEFLDRRSLIGRVRFASAHQLRRLHEVFKQALVKIDVVRLKRDRALVFGEALSGEAELAEDPGFLG